ncbi:BnaA06g37920D [Brassica napus]|uniref:BnaA06g37920D protein n=1 Tax=Brassica napus TaxID=3708 RepID=A0A078JH69_BRANA|nr:BnaA06g37920D [Brassica napus]
MKAQLLLRRAFCSSVTPSANAKITHLSRTSQIHEARKLFDSCDSSSVSSWNSMVSEHFTNRMPREAQLLFDQMGKRNITSWNGLVSEYMNNGEMEEARKVFDDDASHGCSWTQVGDKALTFAMGDIHQEQEAIVKFLDEWDVLLREDGYSPDCDAGEEEKVDSLSERYHSERLAVAYGLLKLPEGVPLRIMKNLKSL